MVHRILAVERLVTNSDLKNLYGECVVGVPDAPTYLSPGSAVPEPVWPSNSGELVVVKSNGADQGIVLVEGLDVNFTAQEEYIAVGGQSLQLFTRINNVVWTESAAFVGTLEVQSVDGVNTYASASPESQTSLDANYSVPANKLTQLVQLYAGILRDTNQQATASFAVHVRQIVGGVNYPFLRVFRFAVSNRGNSSSDYVNYSARMLDGPMDIYVTSTVSDASTEVVTNLSIVLKHDIGGKV